MIDIPSLKLSKLHLAFEAKRITLCDSLLNVCRQSAYENYIINGRGQKKSKRGKVSTLCSTGKMWTTVDLCGDGVVLHLHCSGGYGSLHMW